MKRIAIVCESVTGNTRLLAKELRSHLQSRTISVLEPASTDPDAYDIYFVGSWTDKGDCGTQTAAFLNSLHQKSVFLFGTCGFCMSESYFDMIYHRFAAHVPADNQIIGNFFCQGKMPVEVLNRYKAMKEANPDCTRWDDSIANYNLASSHPDHEDAARFCQTADQALNAIRN